LSKSADDVAHFRLDQLKPKSKKKKKLAKKNNEIKAEKQNEIK